MYEYSFIISKTKKNIPTGSDESTIMASYFPSGVFRINSTAVQIPQYQISNLNINVINNKNITISDMEMNTRIFKTNS